MSEPLSLFFKRVGKSLVFMIILFSLFVNVYMWYWFKRVNMDNPDFANITDYLEGYAYGGDYYCVYTKGQTLDHVKEVDYHERCHILIHEEPEHFCKKHCKRLK